MKQRGQAGFIPVVIGVAILILILMALLPTITSTVAANTGNANLTGGGQAMLPLIPLMYVVMGVAVLVGIVTLAFGMRR